MECTSPSAVMSTIAVVVSPEAWAPIAAPAPRDSSRVSSSTLVLERKRVSFVHSLNLPNTEPQKRKVMATIRDGSLGSPFASREGKSEGRRLEGRLEPAAL